RVLSLAMALMLASSLFLCVLIVPRFRIGPAAPPPHRGKLRQGFERALHGVMGRRWLAFAIPVALLLCLFPLTATIGSGFLPEMDEGNRYNKSATGIAKRSEEHTSELQSRFDLVSRHLL